MHYKGKGASIYIYFRFKVEKALFYLAHIAYFKTEMLFPICKKQKYPKIFLILVSACQILMKIVLRFKVINSLVFFKQLFQRLKVKMEDDEIEMDLHTACSLGDEEYVKQLLEM